MLCMFDFPIVVTLYIIIYDDFTSMGQPMCKKRRPIQCWKKVKIMGRQNGPPSVRTWVARWSQVALMYIQIQIQIQNSLLP